MTNIKPLIGDRIIQACEDLGIPEWGRNRVLGKALGVSPPAVSKWLTNKALPTIDKLFELSDYLGVRAEWLVNGKGPKFRNDEFTSPKIRETMELMEQLNPEQQDAILNLARLLKQTNQQ